jgi:hypothetical protein
MISKIIVLHFLFYKKEIVRNHLLFKTVGPVAFSVLAVPLPAL